MIKKALLYVQRVVYVAVEKVSQALLLLPFAIGWMAGALFRAGRLTLAALVEGFISGNRL